jgi:hypothetical protein
LKIVNADDAKSMVRKYVIGTRSRHGKIASITMDEEAKGPDTSGVWTVTGMFVTEEGDKEQFVASITSRGEVIMANPAPHEMSGKPSPKPRK